MIRLNVVFRPLIFVFGGLLGVACAEKAKETDNQTTKNQVNQMKKKHNPVVYFEIPVTDMDRAIKFYQSVFQFEFEKQEIDGNTMALFPLTEGTFGISGALAQGEIYKPTKDGVVIYFKSENIDETLKKVVANGGKILYPLTSNGELGFVAEFEDSEGNRIALHQSVSD